MCVSTKRIVSPKKKKEWCIQRYLQIVDIRDKSPQEWVRLSMRRTSRVRKTPDQSGASCAFKLGKLKAVTLGRLKTLGTQQLGSTSLKDSWGLGPVSSKPPARMPLSSAPCRIVHGTKCLRPRSPFSSHHTGLGRILNRMGAVLTKPWSLAIRRSLEIFQAHFRRFPGHARRSLRATRKL